MNLPIDPKKMKTNINMEPQTSEAWRKIKDKDFNLFFHDKNQKKSPLAQLIH
jgi:hypothetical protein